MRAFIVAGIAMGLMAAGFIAGVARTRQILIDASEDIASRPVNSFSRCLTEAWEETGELDPEWKGRRKWRLQEQKD